MDQYRRGELVFDVIDAGPADGPVVVLLHGFPQFNTSWDVVIGRLTAQGYRCLAPNQRGYSPGARPTRRRDYRLPELVEDVRALIDVTGAERIHLVGHDWGATVAWATAAEHSDRLASLTAMSVPHMAAFFKALATSKQAVASWYIYFFQLPWLPERLLLGRHRTGTGLTKLLRYWGMAEAADSNAQAMTAPGIFTAALNWYRAVPLANPRAILRQAAVPTMYLWAEGDVGLLEKGARDCGRHVPAEYRFEVLKGSHWIVDEQSDTVADLLLDWFTAHPV